MTMNAKCLAIFTAPLENLQYLTAISTQQNIQPYS